MKQQQLFNIIIFNINNAHTYPFTSCYTHYTYHHHPFTLCSSLSFIVYHHCLQLHPHHLLMLSCWLSSQVSNIITSSLFVYLIIQHHQPWHYSLALCLCSLLLFLWLSSPWCPTLSRWRGFCCVGFTRTPTPLWWHSCHLELWSERERSARKYQEDTEDWSPSPLKTVKTLESNGWSSEPDGWMDSSPFG